MRSLGCEASASDRLAGQSLAMSFLHAVREEFERLSPSGAACMCTAPFSHSSRQNLKRSTSSRA